MLPSFLVARRVLLLPIQWHVGGSNEKQLAPMLGVKTSEKHNAHQRTKNTTFDDA
jgi:hypothetical protein